MFAGHGSRHGGVAICFAQLEPAPVGGFKWFDEGNGDFHQFRLSGNHGHAAIAYVLSPFHSITAPLSECAPKVGLNHVSIQFLPWRPSLPTV